MASSISGAYRDTTLRVMHGVAGDTSAGVSRDPQTGAYRALATPVKPGPKKRPLDADHLAVNALRAVSSTQAFRPPWAVSEVKATPPDPLDLNYTPPHGKIYRFPEHLEPEQTFGQARQDTGYYSNDKEYSHWLQSQYARYRNIEKYKPYFFSDAVNATRSTRINDVLRHSMFEDGGENMYVPYDLRKNSTSLHRGGATPPTWRIPSREMPKPAKYQQFRRPTNLDEH